jgi:rhodanese-related sulfurtransferase
MTATEKMHITSSEMKRMLDAGEEFILLDVRNDDEFARWRIEGRHMPPTVHIPYFVAIEDPDGFMAHVERQIPKDRLVVAVCAKGDSSACTLYRNGEPLELPLEFRERLHRVLRERWKETYGADPA